MAKTVKPSKPISRKPGRPRGSTGPHKPKNQSGVMVPGETLTITAFLDRLGISYTGLRGMMKRGLKVRKDGKYRRIRAADYDDYLANLECVDPFEKKIDDDSEPDPDAKPASD